MKYVDFLGVTMGSSAYNRARKTVWQTADYDTIGCQATPDSPAGKIPGQTTRKITSAQQNPDGFEVNWVYFTPTYPAGYFLDTYLVKTDGEISNLNVPDQPFWACGGGFLF